MPPPDQGPTSGPSARLALGVRVIHLGDRWAAVSLQRESPELLVIDGFLTPEECDALMAAALPRLTGSETVADDESDRVRTSQGMFFDPGETALIRRIDARVATAFDWPLTHAEDLQVTRYQAGQRYDPHYDYFSADTPDDISGVRHFGQRVATVLFYLNEPVAGGETEFLDLQLTVRPRKGCAVFFTYPEASPSSLTLHAGCPVAAGEKWIANKWLRRKAFG